MIKNLLGQFAMKAVYGAAGNTLLNLIELLSSNVPKDIGILETWIWNTLLIGGLTGLLGVNKRVATYDKSKENK